MAQEGLVALHGFAQLRQAVPALRDDQEVGWRLWDGGGGGWGARQRVMPGITERQTSAEISSHTFDDTQPSLKLLQQEQQGQQGQ